MTLTDNTIVVLRHRRAIPVANVGAYEAYKALVAYGVSEVVAQAVSIKLITIRLTA